MIESLRNDYYELRKENDRLRQVVKGNLPSDVAADLLADCFDAKAPKVTTESIDELAGSLGETDLDDEDEDDL